MGSKIDYDNVEKSPPVEPSINVDADTVLLLTIPEFIINEEVNPTEPTSLNTPPLSPIDGIDFATSSLQFEMPESPKESQHDRQEPLLANNITPCDVENNESTSTLILIGTFPRDEIPLNIVSPGEMVPNSSDTVSKARATTPPSVIPNQHSFVG